MTTPPTDIARRKADHIDIVLARQVGFRTLTTGLEAVQFVHQALPELSLAEIDLSASLFGRSLKAPFLISSMTGGPRVAEAVNTHLSEAAEHLGIGLAIGSQRIALEEQGAEGLTRGLRDRAATVPLIGNIGAAQLLGKDGVDRARRAVEMIDADGLYVHLNPLQEAVQLGGDTDWRGVTAAIEALVAEGLPIAIKEVGFGLSADIVERMVAIGVDVIDIAGAGGTNWARVEGARGEAGKQSTIAEAFADWGIPTREAIIAARGVAPQATIIASGGIGTGLDAAKALRLGADLVGQAAGVLAAAIESTEAVIDHFETLIETLRITCFCTGSESIAALKTAPLLDKSSTGA